MRPIIILSICLWTSLHLTAQVSSYHPDVVKNPRSDWEGFMGQVRTYSQVNLQKARVDKSSLLELALQKGTSSNFHTLSKKGYIDPTAKINGLSRLQIEVNKSSPNVKAVEMLDSYYGKAELTRLSIQAIRQYKMPVATTLARGADHTQVLRYAVDRGSARSFSELVASGIKSQDPEILTIAVARRDVNKVSTAIEQLSLSAFEGFRQAHEKGYTEITHVIMQSSGFSKTEGGEYLIKRRDHDLLDQMVTHQNATSLMKTAISYENDPAIRMTVRGGADANQALTYSVSSRKSSLLQFLVREGNANANQVLGTAWNHRHLGSIQTDMEIALQAGADTRSYVLKAAQEGNQAWVEMFLRYGGNPDEAIPDMVTSKSYSLLELLFSRGGDASSPSYMEAAGREGDIRMASLLSRYGARPDYAAASSVQARQSEMVSWLIRQGVDMRDPSYLCMAINNDDASIVQQLLHDARSDAQEGLSCALSNCNEDMVNRLVRAGARLNQPDYLKIVSSNGCDISLVDDILRNRIDPQIGLEPASTNGHLHIVKHLVANGANPELPSLLEGAVGKDQLRVVEYLLSQGSDPNAGRAVYIAVNRSHNRSLRKLIEYNAQVTDPRYIEHAVEKMDAGIAEILARSGADVSPIAYMQSSIRRNAHKLVAVLLKYGADASPQEHLDGAILTQNYTPTAKILLQYGADASHGKYLFSAIEASNPSMVRLLVGQGDLCYQDSRMLSLLHIAAEKRNKEVLQTLIHAGAPTNLRDNRARTPLQIIVTDKQKGNKWKQSNLELAELLVLEGNADPGATVRGKGRKKQALYKVANSAKVKRFLKRESKSYRLDRSRETACKGQQPRQSKQDRPKAKTPLTSRISSTIKAQAENSTALKEKVSRKIKAAGSRMSPGLLKK